MAIRNAEQETLDAKLPIKPLNGTGSHTDGLQNGTDHLAQVQIVEKPRREKEPSPDEMLEAFKYLDTIWGAMESSFTPAQEADREVFVHHREETIGKDRLVHPHRFTDPSGKRRSINVGPQVDTLIGVGLTRLKDENVSDDAKDKIRGAVETLWWNHSVLSPVNRRQSPIRQGLIQRELREISKDPRLTTGSTEGDLALAERRIANWRHINLAPKRIGKPVRGSQSSEEKPKTVSTQPWLTSMIEGAERDNPPLRQDDAPWGRPSIDPKVQVTTTSGKFLTEWKKPKDNPIKETQEDLHTIYLEAWRDAESKRIVRDEANPTPRYFIPEIKAAVSRTILDGTTTPPTQEIDTKDPDTVPRTDGASSPPGGTPITEEGADPDEDPDHDPIDPAGSSPDSIFHFPFLPAPIDSDPFDPWDPGDTRDTGSGDGGLPPFEPTPPVAQKPSALFNLIFSAVDPAFDREAEKWAEQKLQKELTPAEGRFGKIRSFRRLVATRITEEGKRQKYIREYKAALIKTGNPYAEIDNSGKISNPDLDRTDFESSVQATLVGLDRNPDQFAYRKIRADEKLRERISFELYAYIGMRLSPAEIEEKFAKFTKENSVDLRKYFGKDFDSSDFMAGFRSNLVSKVMEVRQAIDSGALTLADVDFNVGFAIPRWGVETQPELTRRDKLIKGAQKRKGSGVLANPLVLGGATSVGTNLAWSAVGLGMRTVAPVVGVLPGAVIGGWNAKARRSYDLKRDRATFERDDASGEIARSDSPRREALGKFAKDKKDARSLVGEIDLAIGPDLATDAGQQILIGRLAELEARLKLSTITNSDYIRFSSSHQIQQERLELQLAHERGIAALRTSGIGFEDFVRAFQESVDERKNELSGASKKRDEEFSSYRKKEARRAFVEGAAKGAVGAGIIAVGTTGIRMASDALGIDVVGGVRNLIEGPKDTAGKTGRTIKSAVRADSFSTEHRVFSAPRPAAVIETRVEIPKLTTPEVQVFAQETPVNFYDAKLNGQPISIPEHTRIVMDRVNGGYDLISSVDGKTVLLNDVRWEEGKLIADPKSLWIDKIQTTTSTEPDIRRVMGKHGAWKEMSADLKSVSWDANGTPGKYDGDELGIFNRRDGNGVVFRIPKSSNGIFLNINGDRVWLPETKDGIVRLDPDSKKLIPGRHDGMTYGDVARIAIDQDELKKYHGSLQTEVHTERREIFRVDTIEAGTLKNGKATIHATIQGCGETPKEIRMGTTTNNVTKILPGEIPVEPDPTPSPSPDPTPTPEPTPVPTPEPTSEMTPKPTPTLTPEPVIPTGSGFTFEFPDLSNINLPPTIATPMARRYPLESLAFVRPTAAPTAPIVASTPHASPGFSSRSGDPLSRGLTDEEKGKIEFYVDQGLTNEDIASSLRITLEQVQEVRYGRKS